MTRRPSPFAAVALVALALGAAPSAAEAVQIVSASNNPIGGATQTGRIAPDTISSQCDGPILKFSPSLTATGSSFSHRNHTFRSLLDEPVCITVDIDSTCTSLFSVAYSPAFNPADPLENYAADMGQSSGTPVYSFSVAGGSSFAVVVHETTTSPSCGDYTLTVSSRGPWAQSFRPSIGGTPSVGSTLSGTNANWVATPSVVRSWRRCDTAGANCSDISGATGATYTVTDADLGHTIRFRYDATDVEATNTSDSAFVEPFIPFETHAAESLGAGDRAHNGIFVRGSVESRCGVPNSAPAILQPMDTFLYDVFPIGSLLNESVCLVARTAPACGTGVTPSIYNPAFAPASGLATNYAGNSSLPFNTAAAVSSILPAGESRELIVSQGNSVGSCASYGVTLGADAPFASVRPGLSGDPVEGGTLTASDGAWSGTPALTTSWRRCDAGGAACEAIPGAAGASYTPTAADVGRRVRARVTATQGRSVSSDSQPSEVVGAGADRTGPQGTVRLGSRNLRKAVKSGRIPVRVTCNEACSVALELRVTRKLARRLQLGKVVIARVKGAAPAGRATPLRAKLTRRARRSLRAHRSLRLTIAAALTDAAGNRTRVTKKASLQRPRRR